MNTNQMHLNFLPENTLIRCINDMVQDKVDAIGLGFEHLLIDGEETFKSRFDAIVELFEESKNSIESIAGVPVNPFVSSHFYNFAQGFNISDVVRDVSQLNESKINIESPQHLVCQAQVSLSKQARGRSYEMEIRMSLVNKDDHQRNVWLYPLSSHTFVLSTFKGDMRG